MTTLAGLTGAIVIAGLVLLAAEATGRGPARQLSPRLRLTRAIRYRALAALAAGLVALAVTRWPVGGLAAAAAVFLLPKVVSTRASRRQTAVLEALEQWTRRIADLLTASRGLEDALQTSARQAPAAIRPAVTALSQRLAARAGTETALRAFAAEVADPAADRIAVALIIATGKRGGSARGVLNSLAVMLARDVAARREIEAARAEHRTTVKWLTGFVIAFTLFAALDRQYSAPYGTAAGQAALVVIVGLYAAALWWLHRLNVTPPRGRILTGRDTNPGRARRAGGVR
jgi:Flp pilus assembly protein TadB